MSEKGELILYRTEDGRTDIHLRATEGTAWLTQAEIAELFETSKQNISLHIRNILDEGELPADSVVKLDLTTAADGKRYKTMTYRLDLILAVGFRVRSPRGAQFRRWAGTTLSEYLVNGFVLNDQRLKDAERVDYFDELLRRIRDIRSSEKRFYQKLRDLFKESSSDYDGTAQTAKAFFATIQNKLVFAVTGRTAAELIVERADPAADNMALTNWPGPRIRKADAVVSKNYLTPSELDQLNRLVTMFLEFAEDRAIRRIETRMSDWIVQTDRFLSFNERAVLPGAGRISHERMETEDPPPVPDEPVPAQHRRPRRRADGGSFRCTDFRTGPQGRLRAGQPAVRQEKQHEHHQRGRRGGP